MSLSVGELERWLQAHIAERCGLRPELVELNRALVDYGISSRDAVELAGRLEEMLGGEVPNTLIWEHPTIERIAVALAGEPEPAPTAFADVIELTGNEPVAVVGLGCRLPGGIAGPEEFWRLLDDGEDAVGVLPPERWMRTESAADGEVLGRTTRAGGFLGDIAGFDAAFFGISPREARRMDPQQRMFLEVGWEALEHAGISPESLRGTRAGVFVGACAGEYGHRSLSDLSTVDAWSGTGGSVGVTANRLSYALDLRGPSLVVDTACSSSLVAVHLGMQSLAAGESDLVIAAGTNLLLDPGVTAAFHEMGVISPTGRCQPFSSSADGIVRAEGVGVLVLKRMSDALADHDRILAVLPGSALNQDGRSNGLTAPNLQAQEELLRLAYRAARVDPNEVDYVEAHGTGTLLGDPIEARALGTVLGSGPSASRPLLIGSAKSSVGHLEAAAGIVGLIKVILAIGRGRIPASLHYADGHPHIDFAALGLSVASRPVDWPRSTHPRRAGVSAFGFGGTNAHVVVEAAPPPSPVDAEDPDAEGIGRFLLGGPDLSRVQESAEVLAGWLEGPGSTARLCDIEGTLARRLSGRVRAGVVARDRRSLITGLRACAEGGRAPNVAQAQAGLLDTPPVWVFSGQGSQWAGMGQRLMRDEPAFGAALAELDELVGAHAGFSVCQELARGEELTAMERLQPVLFAVQVALARLLLERGQEPAAIVGHSLGEVAAAVLAGALSPEDGTRVVTLRSRLLATMTGTGAMALLELPGDELERTLSEHPAVEIAAFNAATQVTVAGPREPIAELVAAIDRSGGVAKQVKSVVAGHCALVDPIVGPLIDGLAGINPRPPEHRVYGTVLADPRAVPAFDAAYWAANIRRPVRFAQAIAAAVEDGHAGFMEISPHPVLGHALADNLRAAGVEHPVVLGTGRRCEDETCHLDAQLTALRLHGDGPPTVGSTTARVIDLPTTRWRHVRHWLHSPARSVPVAAHPLLGERIELPDQSGHTWQIELEPSDSSSRGAERRIGLSTWLGMIHAAAGETLRTRDGAVGARDLVLDEPCAIGDRRTLTTRVELEDGRSGRIAVHARIGRGGWRRHLSGSVVTVSALDADPPAQLDQAIDLDLAPPHPGGRPIEQAIEALLHALGLGRPERWLPRSVGEVRWLGDLTGVTAARVSYRLAGAEAGSELTATLRLTDAEGKACLELRELTLGPASLAELPMPLPDKLLRLEWHAVKAPRAATLNGSWLVIGDPADARSGALADRLRSLGAEATLVARGGAQEALRGTGALDGVVLLVPPGPDAEDPDSVPGRGEELVLQATAIVRALSERPSAVRLYLATCGAVAVAAGDEPDPAQAALRGLLRVLAYEHPELGATWLDLDPQRDIEDLVGELAADDLEDEVAWRGGRRHVARLARVPADALAIEEARIVRADGAYLITGGLGGLGLVLARWLAESGAARVILNGRSAPGPATERILAALRELGTEIIVSLGDIAQPGVAERVVAAGVGPGLRLRGVIHAAAVFEDRILARVDAESLRRVWSAKAAGASRLSTATAGVELDWWVGFSSAAALIGSPGQASYAAANAYLDALTAWRRRQGLVASTINWGTWSQVGQAADRTIEALTPLSPTEGLEVLDALLAARIPAVGALRLEPDLLVESFPELADVPLFSGIVGAGPGSERRASGRWAGVAGLDPATAQTQIRDRVAWRIAEVLGVEAGSLDAHAPLPTLGLDSLLAMRIRNALQHDFDRLLPPSLMLRGASITGVVQWLCEALSVSPSTSDVGPPPTRVAPRDGAERLVAAAWEEVLGLQGMGVTDRLELGDPAAATRVAELLSRRSGRTVAADELENRRTIEQQAALVREPPRAADSPLRRLSDGDGNAPLFLFHPGGGDTLVYRQLVEQLDPQLTVWGIDRLAGALSVEDRAQRYLELVRRVQHTGPYRLGGWSFGGALAYETARRLRAMGHLVQTLALIDTVLPLPDPPGISDTEILERRFRGFSHFLETSYGKTVSLPYERMAKLDDEAQTELLIESVVAAGLLDPVASAAIIEHQRTSYLDVRALDRYRPSPIDVPVVLYSAHDLQPDRMRDPRFERHDPARGWDAVCPEQLEVVTVPGHHLSLLDPPHVDILARHISGLLPRGIPAAA